VSTEYIYIINAEGDILLQLCDNLPTTEIRLRWDENLAEYDLLISLVRSGKSKFVEAIIRARLGQFQV
jgi:hypothetical protein